MNNLILQVVKGKEHASVRAVDGYVAFHRLFIALVDQYPELRVQIKQMVDTFVNDPSKRTKAHIPNLGDFLCMISVLEVRCFAMQMGPFCIERGLTLYRKWIFQVSCKRMLTKC